MHILHSNNRAFSLVWGKLALKKKLKKEKTLHYGGSIIVYVKQERLERAMNGVPLFGRDKSHALSKFHSHIIHCYCTRNLSEHCDFNKTFKENNIKWFNTLEKLSLQGQVFVSLVKGTSMRGTNNCLEGALRQWQGQLLLWIIRPVVYISVSWESWDIQRPVLFSRVDGGFHFRSKCSTTQWADNSGPL